MRQIFVAQFAIEPADFCFLCIAQRTTLRALREFEHGIEMLRLSINEPLPESRGSLLKRFAQRFKDLRIGILGGELPNLFQRIDEEQGIPTYEMKLVPEPVELRLLRIIKH